MSKTGEVCESGYVICERTQEQECDICPSQSTCKYLNQEQGRMSDIEFCLALLGILFLGSYGFAFVVTMVGYGSFADSFAIWPVIFVGTLIVIVIVFLFVFVEEWLGGICEEVYVE